jgi:hypothetical protein
MINTPHGSLGQLTHLVGMQRIHNQLVPAGDVVHDLFQLPGRVYLCLGRNYFHGAVQLAAGLFHFVDQGIDFRFHKNSSGIKDGIIGA